MGKAITVYFSASGVTKTVAKVIADTADTDVYEIMPKIPYTTEDLDWRNGNSRSSLEMNDSTARPEIKEMSADFSAYDTVLLGFPIWWYVAPRIINSFLEAHDFSGKKIILFATSGGSSFGKTADEIKCSVSEDTIVEQGRVFTGPFTEKDVRAWAAGLFA